MRPTVFECIQVFLNVLSSIACEHIQATMFVGVVGSCTFQTGGVFVSIFKAMIVEHQRNQGLERLALAYFARVVF